MTRWHQREIDGLSRRAKKLSIPEDVLERFLPYRDNPSGFRQDILGVESSAPFAHRPLYSHLLAAASSPTLSCYRPDPHRRNMP